MQKSFVVLNPGYAEFICHAERSEASVSINLIYNNV